MTLETSREVICLHCGWQGELPLNTPCPVCGPEDDCLETIEVHPWYFKEEDDDQDRA